MRAGALLALAPQRVALPVRVRHARARARVSLCVPLSRRVRGERCERLKDSIVFAVQRRAESETRLVIRPIYMPRRVVSRSGDESDGSRR